jgi:hypothetical protein
MIELQKARQALLQNEIFIFSSDYGKKGVTDTKAVRLKNQVTTINQFKDHSNYNIFTGYSNICDVDLDCEEVRILADEFLSPTGVMFGRESAPRSHRLYKIIDLDKKHTRVFHQFRDSPTDNCLIELRAHNHYTMCMGKYDDGEKVQYTGITKPAEINWDQLHKDYSMLALAAIVLRKAKNGSPHNQFYKYIASTFKQFKLEEADAERIFRAVLNHNGCPNCKESERLAQFKAAFKREDNQHTRGLPYLVKQYQWSDKEHEDFKSILYAITGRHTLPAFTNKFVDQIVYMKKQNMYYDLNDKEMYKGDAIDVTYARDFKNGKYTPLKFWKQHQDRKVATDFTYKPATKNRFVNVEKKLMVNIYEEHDLQPDSKVDTDIYFALLKHVIPHDVCRNHFLDWNSWIIQNKGKKVRHGLILQSDEFQLGKGSLYDVMRDILGRVNAKKIELEQALDKGKGYLVNSIMVLIDEAKSTGKWEEKQKLINTLKIIISEGSVGIRQLYKEYSESDTCTNYWINTNHRDAFALPPNEVRYWVYFSEAIRNEAMLDEFHNARFNHNLAAGVYAKMLERDVSKFNPNGVAPHTIYRDMMTKLADRPVNDYVRDNFEQGVHPFDRDLVTTVELLDWLKKRPRVRVSRENDVANALKLIGGVRKKGCAVKGVGDNVNIWIIRNHDKYRSMTAKELGKIYIGFWTDTSIAD